MSRRLPFKPDILTLPLNRFGTPFSIIRPWRLYNRFEYIFPETQDTFWAYYQFLMYASRFLTLSFTNSDYIEPNGLQKCYYLFEPPLEKKQDKEDPDFNELDEVDDINPVDIAEFVKEKDTDEIDDTLNSINTLLVATLSQNNVFINLTNIKGKTSYIRNCGLMGLKGPKKRTRIAAQVTVENVCKKVSTSETILYIKGFNKHRRTVFETISNININIAQIIDQTNNVHNGCKKKKKRRV